MLAPVQSVLLIEPFGIETSDRMRQALLFELLLIEPFGIETGDASDDDLGDD